MILICEPQCIGFEHAEVNGALVGVYRIAFPDDPILFVGERTHVEQVSLFLRDREVSGVDFKGIEVAPRNCSNPKRFLLERLVYRRLFELAEGNNADRILFCSVTSPGLYWLKFMLRRHAAIHAIAVLHGILESIFHWADLIRYQLVFWFRFPLLFGNMPQLRYLVFGEFIKKNLTSKFPSMREHLRTLDLPYDFRPERDHTPAFESAIRFGALGVGSRTKGTDAFFRCAAQIGAIRKEASAEFVLVGPLMDDKLSDPPTNVTIPARFKPLPRETYNFLAESIDYAVFFHRKDHYRFSTSAALFDAFSFGKPIIALRSPVFEHYFDMMGDIGYLCADFEEMCLKIEGLLNHFDSTAYAVQRQNILTGRERLSWKYLSNQMTEIWDS
ncbi:MAG: glycosyltransferase [Bacteroidetes bacterium]|nr:glycosyltransferase [Bacteroidota bacterium]